MLMKKALLACSALAAAVPVQAWAQEAGAVGQTTGAGDQTTGAGDQPDRGIGEIVVTARRTEESVQRVPVSVTALGSEQLEALNIQSFADIGKTIPNLDVQRQFGSASAPQFFLRGFSTGSLKFETDAGIGLYIDGVYLGRPAASAFDLADIERVEVMRGPQATLFGRNSTGGAINFITAAPTGELGVKAEIGAGNYDHFNGRASVNLPAIGPLSIRIAYLHDENRGYVKNLASGRIFTFAEPFGTIRSADTLGAERTDAISVAMRLALGSLTADYRFDYTNKKSTQLAQQALPGTDTSFAGPGSCFGEAPSATYLTEVCTDFNSPSKLKVQGHSLTLNYELNDAITLKSITGFRKLDEFVGGNDIDGGARTDPFGSGRPFAYISSIQDRHQKQLTQELQVLGRTGKLDWILGGFYFRETGRDNNPVFLFDVFPNGVIIPRTGEPGVGNTINLVGIPSDYFAGANSTVRNKSMAGYAHLTYKTDSFELAGGVRYTKDDRRENLLAAGIIPFVIPATQYEASSDHWDFDATATYIFNPRVRAYLRFATGYLSGGVLNGVPFKAETAKSYEGGVKADLFDRRLRVNAAVFHTKRRNVQTLGFDAVTGRGTFLYSSPKASNTGFEIEVTAKPISALTLTGSYGYLDDRPGNDGLSGAPIQSLAPKHTLALGLQYDSPEFSNGSYVQFRIDGNYRSRRFSDPVVTAATANVTALPARMDISARLSLLDLPVGGVKVRTTAWVQNLTDNNKLEFARDLNNGIIIGTFQVPRTWGVELGVEF